MLENILEFLIELLEKWNNRESLKLFGARRSSGWRAVRNKHIKRCSVCVVCGTRKNLEVHHILPFNQNPELELDPRNLITLCRKHHLLFGHLRSYRSWNKNVILDASIWSLKIKNRP